MTRILAYPDDNYQPAETRSGVVWCVRCEIHLAMNNDPQLCPSCNPRDEQRDFSPYPSIAQQWHCSSISAQARTNAENAYGIEPLADAERSHP